MTSLYLLYFAFCSTLGAYRHTLYCLACEGWHFQFSCAECPIFRLHQDDRPGRWLGVVYCRFLQSSLSYTKSIFFLLTHFIAQMALYKLIEQMKIRGREAFDEKFGPGESSAPRKVTNYMLQLLRGHSSLFLIVPFIWLFITIVSPGCYLCLHAHI